MLAEGKKNWFNVWGDCETGMVFLEDVDLRGERNIFVLFFDMGMCYRPINRANKQVEPFYIIIFTSTFFACSFALLLSSTIFYRHIFFRDKTCGTEFRFEILFYSRHSLSHSRSYISNDRIQVCYKSLKPMGKYCEKTKKNKWSLESLVNISRQHKTIHLWLYFNRECSQIDKWF